MSGICLDALNPVGHPTPRRLHNIHTDSVRIEVRNHLRYTGYVDELNHNYIQAWPLIGPSTSAELPAAYVNLQETYPTVVIIGNEPDGLGGSSWQMSADIYIALWNDVARVVTKANPDIKLCAAGMVYDPTFLSICWPHLDPKPNIVNKHYPNNEQEIQVFSQEFNVPVIVGEWCWKTAIQSEMTDWVAMLSNNCLEHFWFCWSDGMVDGMGLTNKADRPTAAYRRYKKAIETLS